MYYHLECRHLHVEQWQGRYSRQDADETFTESYSSPRFNKGTAFSLKEREDLDLIGRLPYRVNDLDHQCKRAWEQLDTHENDLRKNNFLQSLKAQNWVLYYSLIYRHLRDLIPIIYTPTGMEFSRIYSAAAIVGAESLISQRLRRFQITRDFSDAARDCSYPTLMPTEWSRTIYQRPKIVK